MTANTCKLGDILNNGVEILICKSSGGKNKNHCNYKQSTISYVNEKGKKLHNQFVSLYMEHLSHLKLKNSRFNHVLKLPVKN